MKRYSFLTLLFLFAIVSCKNKAIESDPSALLEADRAFSSMALEKGGRTAFLYFADSAAVILRDGNHPFEGIDAIGDLLKDTDPNKNSFSWEPDYADIAESGNLGYTYGHWRYEIADTLVNEGTYVTIWKRNDNGEWKWVLDTGTEGLYP